MEKYNPQKIEKKWQTIWAKMGIYKTYDFDRRPKFYCLDMFPYPSGEGLHIGHVAPYTGTDIYSRYLRMKGKNVLHPMGFDAFGLPAENYAIRTGIHPAITTQKNIVKIRQQCKAMGFSYDWDREINTTDPAYYRWTQWIFLLLFKRGLAYRTCAPINWCPSCKTGLANEEVIDGRCERCGAQVTKKKLEQWMLKITAYADRLLNNLKDLDWPENIKSMQENWIGRSKGVEVNFKGIAPHDKTINIPVFTTRPDTLFGATYMVLAPEHPLVKKLTDKKYKNKVKKYVSESIKKTDIERTSQELEKTGLFIGSYAQNPVNGNKIPIWISDYVLQTYGTGAIMAVPAHDTRDFEFAQKFNLPIVEVVSSSGKPSSKLNEAYIEEGKLINSGQFDGLFSKKARKGITEFLAKEKLARRTVCYKLRDWIFSRQRYWGEPIPLIFCEHCKKLVANFKSQVPSYKLKKEFSKGELLNPGWIAVEEKDLPVKLPDVENYKPTGTGQSPLANIKKWVNTKCPKCGRTVKRETNTMPQWAGSCWYYLRYIDPKNNKEIFDKKKVKYWMPVDLYVGGDEHAVLHLLYARFWNQVLHDEGYVSVEEPFLKLINQGVILGPDGQKMSKSRGNIINPDDFIKKYGADALRLYEMFMGPFEDVKKWDPSGIEGTFRFLNKVWSLSQEIISIKSKFSRPEDFPNPLREIVGTETKRLIHETIKKVTEDIEAFHFNTAISTLMEYVNYLIDAKEKLKIEEAPEMWREASKILLFLLYPFAPHLCEELWQKLGFTESISTEKWPTFDKAMIKKDMITLVVQVDGKVREELLIPIRTTKHRVKELALESGKVQKHLEDKKIVRTVYVKDKLINIVTK
jgi:leucyl-tRNA synthetase